MVVQGAVTPGRTRRLMLKLPVGTLRRNSGERVRHKLHLIPLPYFLSSSATLSSLCDHVSVLLCVFVCVCKQDLKRFLANPGDSIRLESVEGKSRAKLLISTVDNTSLCLSSCQSESVNPSTAQSVSVIANIFHCRPQFFKVAGKSHCGSAAFEYGLFACHCRRN